MNTEATPPDAKTTTQGSQFAAACRVLEDAIAAHAFPGCAFGVLAGDQVVLHDARGHFTYESGSAEVAPDTVYDLASVTKVAATTAIAMLLYQRGRLDLERPLGDLLPEFVAGRSPDDPARRVKLRHLLAHNSGLPGYIEFFRTATTADELMRACFRLSLEAEPSTRAEYSDPGFILLGKALEVILGEPLSEWANREVFGPLGMTSAWYSPALSIRGSIPPTEEDTVYRRRRIQGEVQDENAWLLGGVAGHAGLFANVPDLLRFAGEIVNSVSRSAASAGQANLFAGSTVERFGARQEPEGGSRALGWDTPSLNSSSGSHFSPHSIGHLGYSGCSLWIDLDARIAVALLTNRTWPDRQSQLIRAIRPAFHDAVRMALV